MNCPSCGDPNTDDSRFCGKCGAPLPALGSGPKQEPAGFAGIPQSTIDTTARSAGGFVGLLAALLGAVGLGMAADYLVNRVAARAISCACGCLVLVGLLACILIFGLGQSFYAR